MTDLCRAIRIILPGLAAMLLTGCGGYTLKGRVVKGSMSMISMVDPGDQALALGDPVAYADVSLWRDPEQLNRTQAASTRSGSDGWFELPVSAFGAGWMEERWEIRASASGHHRADQFITLPASSGKYRVLIVLSEGRAMPRQGEENLMEEYERYR